MALPTSEELLTLLVSGDPGLAKRALQRLCYAIESGRRVDLTRDPRLYAAIANLKSSPDLFVRRWLYKLVALVRIEPLAPWLEGQLNGMDTDPENISWAAGALHVLVGRANAREKLLKIDVDPDSSIIRLAAGYFGSGAPVEGSVLRNVIDTDDPLAHRWLSLRYGKDPATLPKGVLSDLVTSSIPSVVEYAVWAVHNDPHGRIHDLRLYPQDFRSFPPNVRRWYLRVLLKDKANLLPYSDLLRTAMVDEKPLVREGLALGLVDRIFDSQFADEVSDWFLREQDSVVRLAIARAMYSKRRRFIQFSQVLSTERDVNHSLIGRVFPSTPSSRPAKIFVPITRRVRKERTLRNPLPAIVRDTQENVYLLGVDTVDFSSRTDKQQYTIFRDLVDSLHHEDLVSTENPQDLAVLLTGDGMFVGFRNVASRLSPLRIALRLRRSYRELRAYQLRFGINSGPATWIFFDDGGPQLISHAVNWTARVMSAAEGNQILISDSYYQQCVRSAADELPEATFSRIDGLFTKHAEPLAAWQASD